MTATQLKKNRKAPVELAPDELAALDEGIRSAETERHYTLEEVVKFARERRESWKKIPEAVSA